MTKNVMKNLCLIFIRHYFTLSYQLMLSFFLPFLYLMYSDDSVFFFNVSFKTLTFPPINIFKYLSLIRSRHCSQSRSKFPVFLICRSLALIITTLFARSVSKFWLKIDAIFVKKVAKFALMFWWFESFILASSEILVPELLLSVNCFRHVWRWLAACAIFNSTNSLTTHFKIYYMYNNHRYRMILL